MTAEIDEQLEKNEHVESMARKPFLVVHVIHRLQVGGLENGLVNLINNMPSTKYEHVIISMTEITDYKKRLNSEHVKCYALHKKEGKDFSVYLRLWKLLRKLHPDILHTRNIGTIDCVVPAFFAGVRHCVHGEHGRDMVDIEGRNGRYITLRRLMSPFINRFIALSKDLEHWLLKEVRIPRHKITQIYNGVDLERFKTNASEKSTGLLFGTVGRLSAEKDQLTLINAFITLLDLSPKKFTGLKLVIVGDGPLEERLKSVVKQHGVDDVIVFTGARSDVPELLRELDVFVLPSLGEGISNTILEAMASGLPVVATNVGGNSELVEQDKTGFLVPPNDPKAMAEAMNRYMENRDLLKIHGSCGRQRVEKSFSMPSMVKHYTQVYDELLGIRQ